MKWATFISFLFLFSSAYSRGVFRRDVHKSEIAHRFQQVGEQHFKGLVQFIEYGCPVKFSALMEIFYICADQYGSHWPCMTINYGNCKVLVTISQYLQKCPYEEHVKLVNEMTDFAKTCVADESAENCGKSIHTVFGDKLCAIPTLRANYAALADCCEKQEPDRNECFLQHKDDNPDLPPFVRPDVEAVCTAFQENENNFLGHYLYEVARRHPYFYAPELLYYAEKYKEILTECCQGADKEACLTPKLDALKEKVLASSAQQRLKCASIQKFGERAFKAWALSRLSQKFPKADLTDITKIVADVTEVNKECCHGDLLECADDRAKLAKYICENQDKISSKLKKCCDKPVLHKSHCIYEVEKDEKPDNLPELTADFVEDQNICKSFAEEKDMFMGGFLYEYSRRHPGYSVVLLLRIAKAYEAKLESCCAEDDPPACYSKVLDEVKPLIDEPHNLIKHNCELFEKLGEYGFQNALLVRYTQKTPQVSTPTLVEAARNLGRVGSKCCKLPETERLSCAEDYLSVVLNRLCVLHEKTPVSERVTKCCSESLVNRRPCFSALEVDEAYEPLPFNADSFTFHPDICTLSEKEKQMKKQTALAELVKHKPKATADQMKAVMEDFAGFLEKCCHAENKDECFSVEGAALVTRSKAALA